MAQGVCIGIFIGGLLLASCSSGSSSGDVSQEEEQLALIFQTPQTIVAQMTLPSLLNNAPLLAAQNKVRISSGVNIKGPLWSAGTVEIQSNVVAESVTCTGDVSLANHDTITEVIVGGELIKGHDDVIGATTKTAISNVARITSITFPAATRRIKVAFRESKTLNPGAYVSVDVAAGASLTLLAGDYFVSHLTLEAGSTLQLDSLENPTRIFVKSSMVYRPTLAEDTDPSRLFIAYLGTLPLRIEKVFLGSLIVPRTNLTLGATNQRPHRGTFMAKSINVLPNAKLEWAPFNHVGTTSSCLVDTYDSDGNPFTPCIDKIVCPRGSYVTDDGDTINNRTCTECASGQFSIGINAPECVDWTNCVAGTYVAATPSSIADRLCLPCSVGQYSSGDNQSECLSHGTCTPGSVQLATGTPTSPVTCATCIAGQYCAGDANPPMDCAADTWDNDSDPRTECVAKTDCPPGTFVSSEGSALTDRTCQACTPGNYCPGGASPQLVCTAGTWDGDGNPSTHCVLKTDCAPGTFVSSEGSALTDRTCQACTPGNYCPGGASPQLVCTAGTWDGDGNPSTHCVPKTDCAPGTFVSTEGTTLIDRTCEACVTGQYNTTANASACTPWTDCSPGYYFTNVPSATANRVCTACPGGQYSATTNASACTPHTDCPPGTFVSNYPPSSNSDRVCTPCPAGKYASSSNQSACASQACPAGSTQTAPGTPTTPDQCATCPAGTWDSDANPATACKPLRDCPPGTFATSDGSPTTDRACSICAPGSTFNFQLLSLPSQPEIEYSIVADFNNDGIPDLLSCSSTSPLALGLGDGRFASPVVGNPDTSGLCAVGDYNHDGNLDVFVMKSGMVPINCTYATIDCPTTATVSVFPGLGNGQLGTPITSEVPGVTSAFCGSIARNIALADFNQDGSLDMITANSPSGDPPAMRSGTSVLLGQPDGTFSSSITSCDPSLLPYSGPVVRVGDFNGDSLPDYVIVSQYHGSAMGKVYIGLGNGNFSYSTFAFLFTFGMPASLAPPFVFDMDGDGKQDVLIGPEGASLRGIQIWMNNGGSSPILVPGYLRTSALAAVDLNQDGYPDIVTTVGGLTILWGASALTFPTSTSFTMTAIPSLVNIVDVNSDGRLDVITNVGGVSVLLNQSRCLPQNVADSGADAPGVDGGT